MHVQYIPLMCKCCSWSEVIGHCRMHCLWTAWFPV